MTLFKYLTLLLNMLFLLGLLFFVIFVMPFEPIGNAHGPLFGLKGYAVSYGQMMTALIGGVPLLVITVCTLLSIIQKNDTLFYGAFSGFVFVILIVPVLYFLTANTLSVSFISGVSIIGLLCLMSWSLFRMIRS